MKLTTIILLTTCLVASAAGTAQTIKLDVKDAPLEKVLAQIKKQSGYSFVYYKEDLAKGEKITLRLTSSSIDEILQQVLKNQPLSYKIVDRTIVIARKDNKSVIGSDSEASPQTIVNPPIDISGRVTDADGNPLAGANVKVKGTTQGTTTNADGVFTLKGVDENATLEISYVGYETYTIAVNNKTAIVASLKVKPESLNEVIVNKGYYTEAQKISTSNVTRITSREIEKQPVNNPLLALQGRVPSLVITQATGFAGSGVNVQIQGQVSIGGMGTDPLYVVDGVPYPSRSLYTLNSIQGFPGGGPDIAGLPAGTVSPLSFLNPADIEAIDVLKDADATAIYGSRAANGAILITTKKGKVGKTKVNFNLQTGIGKVGHFLDVMNRRQYLDMRYEALKNDGVIASSNPSATGPYLYSPDLTIWDTTRSTDWQKALIGGTAKYTDIQSNVSGGTVNTQFLVGAGYHKETTVFPGDLADQRGSLHFNINNVTPNQKFRFQFSGSYMLDDNHLMQTDLTGVAVALSPVAPLAKNDDGSLNWALASNGSSTWVNPLTYLYNEFSNNTKNLVSNLIMRYEVFKGLEIKSSFGYNNIQSEQYRTFPLQAVQPEKRVSTVRSSDFSNSEINSWVIEPSGEYKFSLKKLKINTLLGATFLKNSNNRKSQTGSGYTSDIFIKDISSAPTRSAANFFSQYNYSALFGRISGNWSEKYIINLTARRDGSSRFGSQNLFHNFGSIAGAWIFSNESFVAKQLRFLSFGKLRASYGTTGSDQIGDYRFLNLYNTVTGVGVAYQGATGIAPAGLPNPYLQWEETKKLQFGLDIGFFGDKILLTTNYYQNRCSNQLLGYSLPITTGFGSLTRNFPATIQNYGWEFILNASIIKTKDFNWTSSINLTIPKNKLLSFPGIETSSYSSTYAVGQPVTISHRYHFLGINPATGTYLFQTANGNTTSRPSASDLTQIVNMAPKYYGGFQNNISYKAFQLAIFFQYTTQNGSNSYATIGDRAGQLLPDGTGNQPVNVLNRWQNPGDKGSIQRFYAIANTNLLLAAIGATRSDEIDMNASFIRLKNISLSWNLPVQWKRKINLQDASLYVQGQNLLTITKYTGLDPETTSSQSLPPLRIITAGVRIGL